MKKMFKTMFLKRPSRRLPTLRFNPTAWAKLLYLRDRGDSEVGGFATSAADDLLQVDDVHLVRQRCTSASVEFEDGSVADYFDRQVEQGLKPEQFGRIWWHTHPGRSAEPSWLDEETFARVFGRADWALMFILARGGQSYARLQFNVGPGGSAVIAVDVDFNRSFVASDTTAWDQDYRSQVFIQLPVLVNDEFFANCEAHEFAPLAPSPKTTVALEPRQVTFNLLGDLP